MRALPLLTVLLALLAPLTVATAIQDAAGDERLHLGSPVSRDVTASSAGCRAAGSDILAAGAEARDDLVVLTLRVANMTAPPTCHGVAIATDYERYNVDLSSAELSVWTLGGVACNGGAWDCLTVVRHGVWMDDVAPAHASLQGDTWTIALPVTGTTTFGGHPYDLRGLTFELHGIAVEAAETLPIHFQDDAQATGVRFD